MNLLEHSDLLFNVENVLTRFILDFHKQFMGSLSIHACTGIFDTSTYVLLIVSAMEPQITLSSQSTLLGVKLLLDTRSALVLVSRRLVL